MKNSWTYWIALVFLNSVTVGAINSSWATCYHRSNRSACERRSTQQKVSNITVYCCNFEGIELKNDIQKWKHTNNVNSSKNASFIKVNTNSSHWPSKNLVFEYANRGIHVSGSPSIRQYSIRSKYKRSTDSKTSGVTFTFIAGYIMDNPKKSRLMDEKTTNESYVRTDVGGYFLFKQPDQLRNNLTEIHYQYNLVFAEIPTGYSSFREVKIIHECVRFDNYTNQWTSRNCRKLHSTDISISCSCGDMNSSVFGIKLTAFLLNWTSDQLMLIRIVPPILAVSCGLIVITMILLFSFRKQTRSRRTFIQIGICTSFCGQGIMSLLSVWILSFTPMPVTLCESIAYLKLYFAFTSSLWVFMEGAVLCIKLWKAMDYQKSLSTRNLAIISLLIWLVPGAIVIGMGLWEQKPGDERLLDVAEPYRSIYNKNMEIQENYPNATPHPNDVFSKYKLCCPSYESITFFTVFSLIALTCSLNIAISIYVSKVVWQKSDIDVLKKKNKFARLKATAGAVVCLTCCLGLPQFIALVLYKIKIMERIYSTLVLANVITLFEGPFVVLFYCIRNRELRHHLTACITRTQLQRSRITSPYYTG